MIGHTQPRRIAARSVAERIAEELGTELGETVGYQVRFTDRTSKQSRVKVMTDGILLAELQRDRMLERYDTLIIDEAHERSLNVDFLLGYLKRLLPRRPDLKVDHHLGDHRPRALRRALRRCPRPAGADHRGLRPHLPGRGALPAAARGVVRRRGGRAGPPGPDRGDRGRGHRAAGRHRRRHPRVPARASARSATPPTCSSARPRVLSGFDIVPLFSRLSSAEQHRVFERHTRRRVVLATNVAETSLTVPGITGVIDTGLARISRWSSRTKVQRLPIEPVSQASAQQRSGRCGRVEAGVAIRLYSEEDFLARPEFTEPEILRTSLASVILQMTSLGLGQVERFPFVDPPDGRAVRAGVQLLEELGALVPAAGNAPKGPRLTGVGRKLARLPIDPRLARMILEADRLGCLREVLVITAALSIQDPRERPVEQRARADQLHARFRDPRSDFMAWLNLWRHLRDEAEGDGLERLPADVPRGAPELPARAGVAGLRVPAAAGGQAGGAQAGRLGQHGPRRTPTASTRRCCPGCSRTSGCATATGATTSAPGARGSRSSPGSGLFKSQPDFVMAAELVETIRLWGRQNAAIDPAWAERLGRRPGEADLLRAALVEEARVGPGPRARHPVRRTAGRRPRSCPSAGTSPTWPASCSSGTRWCRGSGTPGTASSRPTAGSWRRPRSSSTGRVATTSWWTRRRSSTSTTPGCPPTWSPARTSTPGGSRSAARGPTCSTFDPSMLVHDRADEVRADDFPDEWREGATALPLRYHFEPGHEADGVTIDVPARDPEHRRRRAVHLERARPARTTSSRR